MDLLGYHGGDPRNPVLPLSGEAKSELKAIRQTEGLL